MSSMRPPAWHMAVRSIRARKSSSPHRLDEFHACGGLLAGRIVGEAGSSSANRGHRGRVGIRCAKGALHELVGQASAFLAGQLRGPLYLRSSSRTVIPAR